MNTATGLGKILSGGRHSKKSSLAESVKGKHIDLDQYIAQQQQMHSKGFEHEISTVKDDSIIQPGEITIEKKQLFKQNQSSCENSEDI